MDADRTVVVVEDDPDLRMLLRETFAMQGFTVFDAASGQAGIELVREHHPDLITLDLNLPDLDGITVCRRLREFTDAYIVMITARLDEIDRLMGLEIGADDYVSKPFSPRELKARVNAMFRRPRGSDPRAGGGGGFADRVNAVPEPAPSPAMLVHSDLMVDVEGRVASVGGIELPLTRIEFDLLATLLGGPRRVWTREVLLSTVWGSDWSSDHHLVEVHIGNLRRKLGDTGQTSRFIRTVRGVGYRMAPPAST